MYPAILVLFLSVPPVLIFDHCSVHPFSFHYGPEYSRIQTAVLGYSLAHLLVCSLTHFAHSLARGKMNGYFFCVFLYSGPWWYHGNLCRPKDAFQKHEHHKKRRLDKTRRRNPLSRKEVRGTTTTTTTTLQKSCVCERYNSNNDDDMKDNDVPF